jgi:hypothetical protein
VGIDKTKNWKEFKESSNLNATLRRCGVLQLLIPKQENEKMISCGKRIVQKLKDYEIPRNKFSDRLQIMMMPNPKDY